MEKGFIYLKSLVVFASSPNELLMRMSKLVKTRTLSPVLWCFDWLLDFKVREPAAGRGGATLPWPGGPLQDWRRRDQGMGAWSRPTVCLSRSSAEQKEQVRSVLSSHYFSLCLVWSL